MAEINQFNEQVMDYHTASSITDSLFAGADYSNVGGGYLGPTDADNTEEEIYTQLEIWKEA